MYSASRDILYTAPPAPTNDEDTPAEEEPTETDTPTSIQPSTPTPADD